MKQKHQSLPGDNIHSQQILLQNARKAGDLLPSVATSIHGKQLAAKSSQSQPSSPQFAGSPDPCLMDSPAVSMPPAA